MSWVARPSIHPSGMSHVGLRAVRHLPPGRRSGHHVEQRGKGGRVQEQRATTAEDRDGDPYRGDPAGE
jgi:hypothetical protein